MAHATEETDSLELIATPAIEKRIFFVRRRQVMLDEDLADLYGVETRVLVQQVKRNAKRFPGDFMFQLTSDEAEALRSQIVISNEGRGGADGRASVKCRPVVGGRRFPGSPPVERAQDAGGRDFGIRNRAIAGVVSRLPEASKALTLKVCLPALR